MNHSIALADEWIQGQADHDAVFWRLDPHSFVAKRAPDPAEKLAASDPRTAFDLQ